MLKRLSEESMQASTLSAAAETKLLSLLETAGVVR